MRAKGWGLPRLVVSSDVFETRRGRSIEALGVRRQEFSN
jgi:hypothetical protein